MSNINITERWRRAVEHAKAMRSGGFSHQELPPHYLSGDNILWVDSAMTRLHADNEGLRKDLEFEQSQNAEWSRSHNVNHESILRLEANVAEKDQQVKNLEEYMLKGVAFRDELQAEVARLREAVEWACKHGYRQMEDGYSYDHDGFEDELRRLATASPSGEREEK